MPPVKKTKAETIATSAASCTPMSHGCRSAYDSVTAKRPVSAYVKAMSRKKGSAGSVPGALISSRMADPSSSVLTMTRAAIHQISRRRRPEPLAIRSAC
jgi:hypothetical protein